MPWIRKRREEEKLLFHPRAAHLEAQRRQAYVTDRKFRLSQGLPVYPFKPKWTTNPKGRRAVYPADSDAQKEYDETVKKYFEENNGEE